MPRRRLPTLRVSGEANIGRGARFRDRQLTRYAVSWHPPEMWLCRRTTSDILINPNSRQHVRAARERGKHAMLTYRLNSFQQIAGGIRLHNVPSCSSIQRLPHHLRRVMLGDEQNFKTGGLLLLLN